MCQIQRRPLPVYGRQFTSVVRAHISRVRSLLCAKQAFLHGDSGPADSTRHLRTTPSICWQAGVILTSHAIGLPQASRLVGGWWWTVGKACVGRTFRAVWVPSIPCNVRVGRMMLTVCPFVTASHSAVPRV